MKTLHIAQTIDSWLLKQCMSVGLAFGLAAQLAQLILLSIVCVLSWCAYLIAKKIIIAAVTRLIEKTKNKWDDVFLENRLFHYIAQIAPALVLYSFSSLFTLYGFILERFALSYMLILGFLIIHALLKSVDDIYKTHEVSKEKPITGYLQVIKIFIFIIMSIVVIGVVMNRSPWTLLSGIGALTAVLMLVFKDSILGLVAGIQLAANDMVHIGDWIEMPEYNADGDVIEITLNTIKVQNWDKTITTIPVYALISNSFKNWRGMSESGGRRICRTFYIDMNTIKFCTNEMIEKYKKIDHIYYYIQDKVSEIETYNKENKVDTSIMVNGRHLTNIGTLRAYILEYLKKHPMINQNMTLLVRQLQPTEHGLPMQIYVFCKDKVWAHYEGIQSDIFDHILAIIPEFELKVFQNPTGSDFRRLG